MNFGLTFANISSIMIKDFTKIGSNIISKGLIKTQMKVKNNLVSVIRIGNVDYISLTDLARYKNPIEPKDVIKNWLRAKTNIEFLALWEQMHNPNLKGVEIDTFKSEAGTHYFTMSP